MLLQADFLRLKAEKLFEMTPKDDSELSVNETLKIIQELEKYQSELLSLNNQLIKENYKTEITEKKYTDLYYLSPVSFITLSEDGEILELNFSGSQMLGKEGYQLINGRFGFFISDDTKPIFNHFLAEVFKTHLKETCEVILIGDGQSPIKVRLIGIVDRIEKNCLLIVIDIPAQIPE